LKLDNPEQWFAQTFDSEQAKALVPAYARSFDAFRSRLMKNFEWAANSNANLAIEQRLRPTEGVSPSPTAPTPKTDVAIHSSKCVLAAGGKGRHEWVDSYIMVRGRLQFIGQGAFPFWSAPLSIKAKKAH
jgi:hypothetical protein